MPVLPNLWRSISSLASTPDSTACLTVFLTRPCLHSGRFSSALSKSLLYRSSSLLDNNSSSPAFKLCIARYSGAVSSVTLPRASMPLLTSAKFCAAFFSSRSICPSCLFPLASSKSAFSAPSLAFNEAYLEANLVITIAAPLSSLIASYSSSRIISVGSASASLVYSSL